MTEQYNSTDAGANEHDVIAQRVLERLGYSPDMPYTSPHMLVRAVREAIAETAAVQESHLPEQRQSEPAKPDVYIPYLVN